MTKPYQRNTTQSLIFLLPILLTLLAIVLANYFGDLRALVPEISLKSVVLAIAWSIPFGVVAIVITSNRALAFKPWGDLVRKLVTSEMSFLFNGSSLLPAFLCAALAGISEELLFRGFVQSEFGLLVGTVSFALLHYANFTMFVLLLFAGLLLGVSFEESHNVFIPIVAHFTLDFVVFCRYRTKRDFILGSGELQDRF